jgi:hypothetical protein
MKLMLIRCLAALILSGCCFPLILFARGTSGSPLALAFLVAPDVHVDRLTAVEHAVADARVRATTVGR